MRKLLILIISTLFITVACFGQGKFSATFTRSNNVLTFKLKPDVTTTTGFSTIEFFVRYPIGSPAFTYSPVTVNTTNFPGMTSLGLPGSGSWEIERNNPLYLVEGYQVDHFIYTAPAPVSGVRSYTGGTEYDLITVSLNGAPNTADFQFIHQDTEAFYYLAITGELGNDLRPASFTNYFYPVTSTLPGAAGCTYYFMNVASNLPNLTINDVTRVEGNSGTSTFAFTVSLSAPAGTGGVTFDITTIGANAHAPVDYVGNSLWSQTIPAGSSTYTFNVIVNGDVTIEPDEDFFVRVTNVNGAVVTDGQGRGMITDDDAPTLTINDVTRVEGNTGTSSFAFTVSLSAPAGPGGVTFNIATANRTSTAGSDYVAKSLTSQLIPAGSSTYTFNVLVNGDLTIEPDEDFYVIVSITSGAASTDFIGIGTITNDDFPNLTINDVTKVEGNSGTSVFTFTVSLSAPPGAGGFKFNIATTNGTATAGSDYVANTLISQTIPAGSSTYTFNVLVNGDVTIEPDEDFFVDVTNVSGAVVTDGRGRGMITNDDLPNLTINDITKVEGNSGTSTFAFSVSLSAPAGVGGVKFDIATVDRVATAGSDYVAKSLTSQIIPAGSSTYTFNVLVNGDIIAEPDEHFFVYLTNVSGAVLTDGQGQGMITNDDLPNLTINDVTKVEGNSGTSTFTFTISLSAPAGAGGVKFRIATANGTATTGSDYVANTLTSQTIPAGSSTYAFDVTVNGDITIEPDETFFVNVTSVIGANVTDAQGMGTITNDDLPNLKISDVTKAEGNSGTSTFAFTVSLSAPASTGGVKFSIATANGTATAGSDYAAITPAIIFTIPAGSSTYTFNVSVNGDATVEPDETFFVNVTSVIGANVTDAQGMGTITNDDLPNLKIGDVTRVEGNSGTSIVTFTLYLSEPAGAGAVKFKIATANGTATAGSDYVASTLTSQTFPTGSYTYLFNVTVNGDIIIEPDETFFVNVTNVSGAVVTDAQAVGTITNDDKTGIITGEVFSTTKSPLTSGSVKPDTMSDTKVEKLLPSKPQEIVIAKGVEVYPNPTTGEFTLQVLNCKAPGVTIQILNANGNMIKQQSIQLTAKTSSFTVPFNLTNQPAGMYFIKVSSREEVQIAKLVIQH